MSGGIVSDRYMDCNYFLVINSINNNLHLLGLNMCQRLTLSALKYYLILTLEQL